MTTRRQVEEITRERGITVRLLEASENGPARLELVFEADAEKNIDGWTLSVEMLNTNDLDRFALALNDVTLEYLFKREFAWMRARG